MADKSADVSGVSGAERAAILLLTLGEQDAAELLRHMDPREVQRVGQAMAGLKNSFDPAGMFNPEKIFPKGYMCGEVRSLRMQAMAQKHGIYAL